MQKEVCTDAALLDDWQVVRAVSELYTGRVMTTQLLGQPIALARTADGQTIAWDNRRGEHADGQTLRTMPSEARYQTLVQYGHVWVCLRNPSRELFRIPEADEPDRRLFTGGRIRVKVSGLRLIENFLDMAHFPYVHTGILGAEPLTEVRDYQVDISSEDELYATGCGFHQPKASAMASQGREVEYTYRLPRPYCAMLYKSHSTQPSRFDVLAIFLQPSGQEECIAHPWRALLDDQHSDAEIRGFQQSIFAQDRPIIENQVPRRLPLDPRAERPVRCDAASTVFRRWLGKKGISFGAIP